MKFIKVNPLFEYRENLYAEIKKMYGG